MWCLVDGTAGNAEVTSLNVLLGSWGVVPEVLEISQLGHYVAEHLVEPRRRSSRTEACVHTWPLRHRTHHPTLVVEQVDNEVQPILLEHSSSIEIPLTSLAVADVLASINTSALASPARARHQEWFT